jgi:hypothetical protein
MENRRCAKFILRNTLLPSTTSGGASSASNSVGSRNNNGKTNVTFTTINFRQILGSLYDEYDLFNLQLVGCAQVSGSDTPNDVSETTVAISGGANTNAVYGNTISDRNILITLSGLTFLNSLDHNKSTKSVILSAPLLLNSSLQTAFTVINTGGFISTFRKPPGIIDLTIDIKRCIDDTTAVNATTGVSSTAFGTANFVNCDYNMVYIFNIYPIDLEEIDSFQASRQRQLLKI